MTPLPSIAQIREWIRFACEANNVTTFFQPHIIWKKNYTWKMGSAHYRKMVIALSVPLFERATVEEQRNTVIHEACHLIAIHQNNGIRVKSHGYEWQRCMRRAGLVPKRCHSIEPVGVAPNVFVCGCREHHVTKNKHTRIMKNIDKAEAAYRCTTCKQPLRIK